MKKRWTLTTLSFSFRPRRIEELAELSLKCLPSLTCSPREVKWCAQGSKSQGSSSWSRALVPAVPGTLLLGPQVSICWKCGFFKSYWLVWQRWAVGSCLQLGPLERQIKGDMAGRQLICCFSDPLQGSGILVWGDLADFFTPNIIQSLLFQKWDGFVFHWSQWQRWHWPQSWYVGVCSVGVI